jgi:hypothetical protein
LDAGDIMVSIDRRVTVAHWYSMQEDYWDRWSNGE